MRETRSAPTLLPMVAALLLAGCGDGAMTGDDDDDVLVTEGGRLTLDECGYDVVTRVGATAPERALRSWGPDPTPRNVHLGFVGDPATSMAIQWRTADESTEASVVQWGEADALDNESDGIGFVYIGGFNQNGEPVRVHEAHLCGLRPNTRYSYRIGTGEGTWSNTYTFHTAPAAGSDEELVIAAVGDSRDGYDVWAQLAELARAQAVDLVLFTGDAVTIGAIQTEWEDFFAAGEPLLAETPIVSAHGNHEVNAINFFAQFVQPGDRENFGFDFGQVHVTVANDTPLVQSDIEGPIAELIEADLAATDRRWKMFLHHRSMYSASTRHGSDELLRDAWGPALDAHEVDLVLSGHDHTYERSLPMRDDTEAAPGEGAVYVVSGGAGAGLYESGEDYWTAVSESTHSLLIVRVGATMIEATAYDETGTVIDEFVIPAIAQ